MKLIFKINFDGYEVFPNSLKYYQDNLGHKCLFY